jgi:hypothetical protein
MKKLLLTAIIALCSFASVSANNNILGILNIGGRIGIISSSETIPMDGEAIKESITAEGTGWTGNIFARINLPKLPIYIQPELQYTKTTIDIPSFDIDSILGKEEEAVVESHRYIDMHILIGAEFGLGSLVSVRVNAGPVFAIASEKGFKDLTQNDFLQAWDNLLAEPQMTWTAGLGVKVLSLIAEIRYNGNFNSGASATDLAGAVNTARTSWNMSIGVMF